MNGQLPFTSHDEKHMRRALELAKRAWGETRPNPLVGAVLVDSDGRMIGEGYHRRAGLPHAEVEAISAARAAGHDVSGTTLYVTMEPCNHQGRTGPCSIAVAQAGIARVVAGMADPNPAAGGGREYLRGEGVIVETGCLQEEVLLLNPGFNTLHMLGRPLVKLKWAMTMDGCASVSSGESKWVTGEFARQEVHRRRSRQDAILAGVVTVQRDNARLTARVPDPVPGPRLIRIVLDTDLKLPTSAPIYHEITDSPLVIACADDIPNSRTAEVSDAGGEILRLPRAPRGLALEPLLHELGRRQVQTLYVEGGRTVAGSFLATGLVDCIESWIAPRLIGGGTSHLGPVQLPMPIASMSATPYLHDLSVGRFGDDFLIEGWLTDHLFVTKPAP